MQDKLTKAIELYDLRGVHPAANLMPMMSEDEYAELVRDVRENGFIHPVRVTNEGLLIDGRNRLCASIEEDVQKDVRIEVYNPVDPIQYVLSENLQRRHLTTGQKAMIATEAEKLYAEEAKKRQAEAGAKNLENYKENNESLVPVNSPERQKEQREAEEYREYKEYWMNLSDEERERLEKERKRLDKKREEWIERIIKEQAESQKKNRDNESAVKAGKAIGVGEQSVRRAKKLQESNPDLADKVKTGELSLNKAVKQAKQKEQAKELAQEVAPPPPATPAPETETGTKQTESAETEPKTEQPKQSEPDQKTETESTETTQKTESAKTEPPVLELKSEPVKTEPKKAKKKFNMPSDSIEWAKYSWNPVSGCKFGCPYCYARDIGMHYHGHFDPTFHEDRLDMPADTKCKKGFPNNVFVCSMADLFGDWVPVEWIERVLESVRNNPQWNYLFLTKNPKRYLEFEFPDHCWLGATADIQSRADSAIETFNQMDDRHVHFLSCEPLLELVDISKAENLQWVIIGSQTKNGQVVFQPEWTWIEKLIAISHIKEIPIYWKPNLNVKPKNYPVGFTF